MDMHAWISSELQDTVWPMQYDLLKTFLAILVISCTILLKCVGVQFTGFIAWSQITDHSA